MAACDRYRATYPDGIGPCMTCGYFSAEHLHEIEKRFPPEQKAALEEALKPTPPCEKYLNPSHLLGAKCTRCGHTHEAHRNARLEKLGVSLNPGPQSEASFDVQPPKKPDPNQGHEFYFQHQDGIRVWVDKPKNLSKRYMLYALAKAFLQEMYQEGN